MNQVYKIYQLMFFFIAKFSYKTVVIQNNKKEELWLTNPQNATYPIIRVTTNSIEQVMFEKDNIQKVVQLISGSMRIKEPRFLDIHIGHDEILDNEVFDSMAIDSDYYDGIDISYAFPGIKQAIHEVRDGNVEIQAIMNELNQIALTQKKQKRSLKRIPILVTYTTIAICVIVFLLEMLLSMKYDNIASMIVLGADYKMFTLGLGQFWRLLTCAFSHGGLLHLFMNLYSLYVLGSVLETEMGSLKFGLTLGLSVVCGSLTHGIFAGNTIAVGISGGLYGLMAVYFILCYKNGFLNWNNILQILFLNLAINFMGNVGFMAHVGGFVAGLIACFMFVEKKQKTIAIIAMVALVGTLSFKYISDRTIRPIYGGTDKAVLEIYRDFGLRSYANHLSERLFKAYQR